MSAFLVSFALFAAAFFVGYSYGTRRPGARQPSAALPALLSARARRPTDRRRTRRESMTRFIMRFECPDGGGERFAEWSTIVDAPVTYAMTETEFREYYQGEYGRSRMDELDARLARARAKGTSAYDYDSLEDLVEVNRAGPNESEATLTEIIASLCAPSDSGSASGETK